MVEFMVLALPRSGTTWAANWLTTDTTLCLHDPLFKRHYSELDAIETSKALGVSCTGLWNWPEWVNAHPARKVVLHRDLAEVNESLAAIGLAPMTEAQEEKLYAVEGVHVDWKTIFTDPRRIYEFLLQKPFDAERHAELVGIQMQPDFSALEINPNVTKRILEELRGG